MGTLLQLNHKTGCETMAQNLGEPPQRPFCRIIFGVGVEIQGQRSYPKRPRYQEFKVSGPKNHTLKVLGPEVLNIGYLDPLGKERERSCDSGLAGCGPRTSGECFRAFRNWNHAKSGS